MCQQPVEAPRYWETRSSSRIVLTFHGLGVLPHELAAHSDPEMWIEAARFEALLDRLPAGVELTFDDGFLSCLTIAVPALIARNLRARFFVTRGHLGLRGYLSERDLHNLIEAGMQIGSHGMRHRPWRRLDYRALVEEIFETKDCLEQIVQGPVTEAACPFGEYDRQTLAALRRAGMKRVYTSDRLPAKLGSWIVPRYTLRASETLENWIGIVHQREPAFPWLRRIRAAAKRWR